MTSFQSRLSLVAVVAALTVAMAPDADARSSRSATVGSTVRMIVPDTTLAEGAFTKEQVERGEEVFTARCTECHSTSDVRGTDFMFNWEGSSVGRLYRTITRTMPEDDPGGLPTADYLAVISYILDLNGFPAGEVALTADTELLNKLRIEN